MTALPIATPITGREPAIGSAGHARPAAVRLNCASAAAAGFRCAGYRWRQFHHRGSIEDAGMLARYRDAVR
jgi:hypothetical protein